MTQVLMGPLLVMLGIGALKWGALWWAIAALLAARGIYYVLLTSELRWFERGAAAVLGLCCDAIYSAAFISGCILWVGRGKSALHSARARVLRADAKSR